MNMYNYIELNVKSFLNLDYKYLLLSIYVVVLVKLMCKEEKKNNCNFTMCRKQRPAQYYEYDVLYCAVKADDLKNWIGFRLIFDFR